VNKSVSVSLQQWKWRSIWAIRAGKSLQFEMLFK